MSAVPPEQLDQWMTAAVQADDQDAFAQVVTTCHHMVRAMILRETADADLADEIAQEVFVRAWVKREQYRPGTNPRAWLLAIARSQLMEYHRRQSRDSRHLPVLIRREMLRRSGQWETPNEDLSSQRLAALSACLGKLESDQRELINLVHGQGLSTADAAEMVGIQPATCRQRLSRLQRSLRNCAEQRLKESS